MNFTKIASILFVALFALTGCSVAYGEQSTATPLPTQDEADSQASLERLRWADQVVLQKKVLSLRDHYDVTADDEAAGIITGEYFYAIGDTFTFLNENDNLLGSEGEEFRIVTHGAVAFDYNNEHTTSFDEKFTIALKTWDILDVDGEKIGYAKQVLGFSLKLDIFDLEGNLEYTVRKAIVSMGSKLEIERVAAEPQVHMIDAIWLATISNEIHEAEESKKSKN